MIDYKSAKKWLSMEQFVVRLFWFLLTSAAIAVPFFALWAFSDSLPFQDEIATYRAHCPDGLKDGKCQKKEEASLKVTYRALVDQQTVIYWIDGGSPERLTLCAVRNSRNWTCKTDGINESRKMIEGAYQDDFLKGSSAHFYQVSKVYWWGLIVGLSGAVNSFGEFLGIVILVGIVGFGMRVAEAIHRQMAPHASGITDVPYLLMIGVPIVLIAFIMVAASFIGNIVSG